MPNKSPKIKTQKELTTDNQPVSSFKVPQGGGRAYPDGTSLPENAGRSRTGEIYGPVGTLG